MADDTTTMAALIANSGKTDPRMWEAVSNIPKAYYEGQDQAYKQRTRNVFSDENGGIPRDPKTGEIDYRKAFERLVTVGGAPAVDSASKLAETGFQQDRYSNAPSVQRMLWGDLSQAPTANFPPSANRGASAVVLPPLARGGLPAGGAAAAQPAAAAPAPDSSWRGGDAKGSLIGFLSANNVPEQDQGAAANIIGGQLSAALGRRIDPNEPLNMKDMQVRQVLGNFLRSNGRGPLAQSTGGEEPQAAQPAMAAPVGAPAAGRPPIAAPAAPATAPQTQTTDPTLGGLVPPGYDPGEYVRRLDAVAGSGRVLPDQLKVLQARIEAIRKALEPTPDMKNARAAGMSVKDYLDRSDTNMADRDILTKSILPKLDKSQETATAARDEIQAIHRSREQLDAPGGIFNGAAADVRLKVAKVAEFLGVPNADKISSTEAFGAAIGSRTLALVKGLGAGAGISNADRDFAAAMAGGNIKLDEKSIRKILDIGEKAARTRIDQHNGLADRTLKSTDALKGYSDVYRVEQPGQYQRIGAAPPPQRGDVVDGHRFLGGNPKDPRSWGAI